MSEQRDHEAPAEADWEPDVDRVYVVIAAGGEKIVGVKRGSKQHEYRPEYVEIMAMDHVVALLNGLTGRVAWLEQFTANKKRRWWRR